MKKNILAITIIAIVVGAFVYQSYNKTEDNIIRIGAILPLTGKNAYIGNWQKNGIELALNEIKQSGQKLEIIFEDSQNNAAKGVTIVNKLKSQGINCIIASMSQVANALIPVTEKNNQLLFLNTVSYPDITKGKKNVFRMHISSDA